MVGVSLNEALAQGAGETFIPAPPLHAERDLSDPERAFDPSTGQNLFWDCVEKTWVDAKTGKALGFKGPRASDGTAIPAPPLHAERDVSSLERAFNPSSGQNLFWDRKAKTWKDSKTGKALGFRGARSTKVCPPRTATAPPPPAPPQVGMVIEPKISIGLGGFSTSPTYDSTGGQAPFSGDRFHTNGQFCGGATVWPGYVIGPARVGLDVNVCSGSNTFGSGDTTLFTIMRHGPGDVDLRSSTKVMIDVLFKGEVPVGPTNNLFLSAGIGPTFRDLNLTLTSNQSFFGGGVPSVSDSKWQTGLGLSAGLSTIVCPSCIAGNPLKVGVEGRARFFPSQSISLRSPAFGFTETGSAGRTTDYSALLTFAVPFGIPR